MVSRDNNFSVLWLMGECEDPGEGDADPGGAVVEFVEKLVEGFFEQVGVEQQVCLLGLGGESWIRGHGGAPGVEELGGDGVLPEDGPGFEGFCGVGVALGEVVEAGEGGVAEGAEHAGDVLQGGLLGAALGEGAGGFAFEVEDDVVAAGAEDLAEVVVAVDADALAGVGGGGTGEGVGAGEELDAAREDEGCGVGGELVRQGGEGVLEGVEGAVDLGVDAGGVGGEGFGGEGLGCEGGVVGRSGEGEMHLGGAAAEEGGGVEVEAGVFAGEGGNFCGAGVGGEFVEEGGQGADVFRGGAGDAGFVEAGELVEGEGPAVAFVFDEALEHGEGGLFVVGGLVAVAAAADVAEERRDAGEVGDFGEEAADLGVGVFAGLEAAEELEDQFLIVEDGGVGLLGGAGAGGEGVGAAGGGEGGGFVAGDGGVRG